MKETWIHLKDFGLALSGRSRAREIVINCKISPGEFVVIDFEGVEAVNHSFVNEVMSFILRSKADIQVINLPMHSAGLIENEMIRLRQIIHF